MKSTFLVSRAFQHLEEAQAEVKNSLATLVKEMQGNSLCVKFNKETLYPLFSFFGCDGSIHSVFGVLVTPYDELLIYIDDCPYENMDKEAEIRDGDAWFNPEAFGKLNYESLYNCLKAKSEESN